MLRQLALRHQLGIPLPPPCPVPAPFPTMLRLRHGAIPSLPLVVAVALPDRGTQLYETEEPLVTRPRQDPTLATNGKFWAAFVPRAKRVCWDMETLRSLSTAASRSQGVEVTPQALL